MTHEHPPVKGCRCWQCEMERSLAESGKQSRVKGNKNTVESEPSDGAFAYEESRQERKIHKRNNRWLERRGYL